MATIIQLKRGLNANLASLTLLAGEPAFVLDTGKLYIGDGTEKVLINAIDKPSGIDTSTTYTKFQVNEYGQIILTADITESDLPNISISKITGLGTSATHNVGTSEGEIPTLGVGGKLPESVIPTLTGYVTSVNTLSGDVVVNGNNLYATNYTIASSYTPIAATDSLNTAVGKLEKNFDNFAHLASPAFTGTPTAPTQTASDNSTKLATTAFVQNALATIDGGTF